MYFDVGELNHYGPKNSDLTVKSVRNARTHLAGE